MTCIAWDGHTLAADKRCCLGTMVNVVTKIWPLDTPSGRVLFGGAGSFDACQAMSNWVEQGCDPVKFPEEQKGDKWAHVIVVDEDGARQYEQSPYPICYDDPVVTLGSGREFARAAMFLGRNAHDAVAVACALDSGCGNGIDTLTLEPQGAQ